MAIPMSATRVDRLLSELCVDLGFCLPPEDQERLRDSPPSTIDAFTDAVFIAEGMDPLVPPQLRKQVRARDQAFLRVPQALSRSSSKRTSRHASGEVRIN
jgi:hypothetical protein